MATSAFLFFDGVRAGPTWRHRAIGRPLVVAQLAASLVLLVGAGLTAKSYQTLSPSTWT